MQSVKTRSLTVLAGTALVLACSASAMGGDGGFDIRWSTVDSGGGASSGGGFTVAGSLGQHDAGTMGAGGFELAGGFWPGASPTKAPPPACPGDLNGDQSVDSQDLNILLGAFASSAGGDLDDDGDTDSADLNILLAQFGSSCD